MIRVFKRFASGGHYKGYNEPTGHLFNIPPAPPGYRRKKLFPEIIWQYLFGGTTLVFFVLNYYKPEDEMSAWAKEEARRRLKWDDFKDDRF